GPGRISFSDYVRLRLFDDAWWGGVDRRAVVGRRRARELELQINGAGGGPWSNPLAVSAYLAAFGFPVPEVVAIYANDLAAPGKTLLRTREQLRAFLEDPEAAWTHGRAVGEAPHPMVRTRQGPALLATRAQGVDAVIDYLADNAGGGYLFERRPAPHPA